MLDVKGSAGIEWMPTVGATPGLLLGSCGRLQSVPLAATERGPIVAVSGHVSPRATDLWAAPGCITSVERGPEDMVFFTVFTYGPGPALYVVSLR